MKNLLPITAIALAVCFVTAGARASDTEAMKKAGCLACHADDKKIVGPSYKDVAKKYAGQPDAVAKLTEKVRKGGSGVWGPVPMSPNPVSKISDADLKVAVEYILSLK